MSSFAVPNFSMWCEHVCVQQLPSCWYEFAVLPQKCHKFPWQHTYILSAIMPLPSQPVANRRESSIGAWLARAKAENLIAHLWLVSKCFSAFYLLSLAHSLRSHLTFLRVCVCESNIKSVCRFSWLFGSSALAIELILTVDDFISSSSSPAAPVLQRSFARLLIFS